MYVSDATIRAEAGGKAKQRSASGVAANVSRRRKELRERGLRWIQMCVIGTPHADFAEEARRQSAATAASEQAADDQSCFDAIS
ncbi:antitoxin MazE-like protein [Candidatus Poriferisodalis sp.]|uniref:antitoxin MazE-like protein n=1 Tax=Candidatus Poriferisodalis sp. TaxID=3101277 RepID=UPI003B02B819